MKPVHGVVAVVLAVVWFGTLGFVLTHGNGSQSAVDVYTELPPGFTTQLQAHGVRYQGLSPVDSSVVQQVLAHATPGGSGGTGSSPIVLRTSFSDTTKGQTFANQAALMVVVPSSRSASVTGSGPVYVAFLDPTTYKTLASFTSGSSGASG